MLYVVATPIGNLEDISLRALRILKEVNFVLCEDARVTKKILDHYKIQTNFFTYHQHSDERKIKEILNLLGANKKLALVTDAGTPGISDPGGKLVQAVVDAQQNAPEEEKEKFKVESVPGPSALTAALSISGLPTDKFIFMGFPPHKNGRQTFVNKILQSEWPVIIYESKHRIVKFLEELQKADQTLQAINLKKTEQNQIKNFYKTKEKQIPPLQSLVVCRELSKKFETIYRGEIETIINKIKSEANEQRGEFVVIVGR